MITPAEQKLLSHVQREELVGLTQDLVRIDSVIRPDTGGTERDVVAYLEKWVRRELGIECLVEEAAPGRLNLIATLDSGRQGPCLMLEGHTDVVSEGDPSAWTHPPFAAETAEGRICGRGACDMKAGIAVALVASAALAIYIPARRAMLIDPIVALRYE